MKKSLLFLFLILGLTVAPNFAQKAKTSPKPKILPKTAPKVSVKNASAAPKTADYEVPFVNKVLPNGFEIIVLADSAVPLVTVELASRNGSFTEPPELNGLSHLYEHMFFKTNDAMRRGEPYLRNIGQLGITYNGSTREEVVNYYFTTTASYWRTAMRFVRDAARYPTFDEEEFAGEIEVVLGEMDRAESNPYSFISQAMTNKLFYQYPSRKTPIGNRQTVKNATIEQMRLIQSRYYVPNNCALIVTGDVEPEKVFAEAEKLFGDWKRRVPDPFVEFPLVEHPPLKKSEGAIIEQPINTPFFQIGWHGPSIGKDDAATYAADVFSFILRQPDSRFSRKLVDSGLTVGVDLTYYTQRNVGPITLTFVTSPEKAREALKAVHAEIAAFDTPDYFTDEELESAKALLEADDLYSREKLSEYAHTLGFWWSSTGIEYFRGYQKNLRAVTRADINRYIRTYIKGKPYVSLGLMSAEANAQIKLTEAELLGK